MKSNNRRKIGQQLHEHRGSEYPLVAHRCWVTNLVPVPNFSTRVGLPNPIVVDAFREGLWHKNHEIEAIMSLSCARTKRLCIVLCGLQRPWKSSPRRSIMARKDLKRWSTLRTHTFLPTYSDAVPVTSFPLFLKSDRFTFFFVKNHIGNAILHRKFLGRNWTREHALY